MNGREQPPPSPGYVEIRIRGRRGDIDALLPILESVAEMWHERVYEDRNGVTVRQHVRARVPAVDVTEGSGGSALP